MQATEQTIDDAMLYKKIEVESFLVSSCFTRVISMVKPDKILRLNTNPQTKRKESA